MPTGQNDYQLKGVALRTLGRTFETLRATENPDRSAHWAERVNSRAAELLA